MERSQITMQPKEVSARLSEISKGKNGCQQGSESPKNGPILVALPCSTLIWEQPMGSMALEQTGDGCS